MKAQEFLELVAVMMTAQADYYAARKVGKPKQEQIDMLVKSKQVEARVRAVIKDGRLEPDMQSNLSTESNDDK